MTVDWRKLFILVLFCIAPHVLATKDNAIKAVRGMRGSMSGIDLNLAPEILPEEHIHMDTRREGQEEVLGDMHGNIIDSSNSTPKSDLRAFAVNDSASTALASNVQTSEPSMKRTKCGTQGRSPRKPAARRTSESKIKMRPLAQIYRSNEELEKSDSMSESKGLSSSTKSPEKLRSESRAHEGLSRPKKRKAVLEGSTGRKKSIASVLRQETLPTTLESTSQKEQSPMRDAEQDQLSKELLALISVVRKAQNQGRLSNGVHTQTKYPPLFKKMVVESCGDFKTQAAAAAHYNITESTISAWMRQYNGSGGKMDFCNYIEERQKFKKEVVEWHKTHGRNITETSRMFHIDNTTLRSWLKAEETPDGIESFLSSKTLHSDLKVTKYPEEVQKAVVEYYQKSGDTQKKVAAVLGLPRSRISTWQKKFRSEEDMTKN